ncbi:MFS transporter [Arthrobacter sp. StoSoilB20]|uniref:MFS transporter n=1 Tax=Arthrobacter sp. StoSoilB20 TaxID=2830995 RepID=UPI001CC3BBB4|nr:MFS transporter [Arthrobacter sp. StoSoilB20]BCW58575.1 MFS transporter [Arthrobacter sp. StoSoilB20]
MTVTTKVGKPLHGRHHEWTLLLLLAGAYGITSFDRWLLPTLFPVMSADLGLNVGDLGNISAAFSIVFGVLAVVAGTGSDRWGRRRIMVPALVIFSICSALTGFFTSVIAILVVRTILGMAEGAFTPTIYAAMVEASHPKRRGLNMGLLISAFPLFGLGIGPIIATQLLTVVPTWHWVFYLSAVPGVILAILIARRQKDRPNYPLEGISTIESQSTREAFNPRSMIRVLRQRNMSIALVSTILALAAMFVLGGLIPSYLTSVVGVSVTNMGLIASAIGFGGFAGQVALAGLSDLWGRRTLLIAEGAGAAVCLMFITAVGNSPTALFAILFGAAFFCFAVLSLLGGPITAEAAPRGFLGTSNGVVIGAGEIIGSGIAASLIGNFVVSAGLQIAPAIAAACMGLIALLGLALRETAPRIVERRTQSTDSIPPALVGEKQ